MASDTNGTGGPEKTAHEKVMAEIAAAKTRRADASTDAGGEPLRAVRDFARQQWEGRAIDDRHRWRKSFAAALAINIAVLTALGVFGRVRIWVPNAPSDSISVVFVDLPEDPIFPELRDPETVPEPEPEPRDPEIVEEPEIEDAPEPEPEPEPEDALQDEQQPEEQEPEVEPEPTPAIDLTPEPVFAPPAEEIGPFIPETAPANVRETNAAEDGAESQLDQFAVDEQSPEASDQPLVEDEAADAGVEFADEEDAEDDGEMIVGEDDEALAPPAEIDEGEQVTGDDLFDNQSRFIRPRMALPLPNVDLPDGELPALPGESGVVAIFCPEEFDNEDKQKECAGRREIRSGWRPGDSGENFDEAARLLRQRREEGVAGPATRTLPPAVARRLEDERRARELSDFRRSADDINDLPQTTDALGDALGRPDIGPDAVEPSWTRREDPIFDQDDIEELEKALREAEEKRN